MPTDNKARQAALNAASNAADRRLREAHQDEWNSLKMEEASLRGETWFPKKSDEERAAEQLAALLAEFPHLADTVNAGVPGTGTPPVTGLRERLDSPVPTVEGVGSDSTT